MRAESGRAKKGLYYRKGLGRRSGLKNITTHSNMVVAGDGAQGPKMKAGGKEERYTKGSRVRALGSK